MIAQVQEYLNLPKDARAHLESAWNELHGLCSSMIIGLARGSFGVAVHDLEECLQAVWCEIAISLPKFKHDPQTARFESWLFKIVRSKAANLRLDRKRLSRGKSTKLNSLVDDCDMQNHFEVLEFGNALWEFARAKLSRPQFQIIELKMIEELSGLEIAARLGISHGQARDRLFKALRKIEKEWAQHEMAQDESRLDSDL
jgi:RNA polymerase sigma factor (sigma-70 family)